MELEKASWHNHRTYCWITILKLLFPATLPPYLLWLLLGLTCNALYFWFHGKYIYLHYRSLLSCNTLSPSSQQNIYSLPPPWSFSVLLSTWSTLEPRNYLIWSVDWLLCFHWQSVFPSRWFTIGRGVFLESRGSCLKPMETRDSCILQPLFYSHNKVCKTQQGGCFQHDPMAITCLVLCFIFI